MKPMGGSQKPVEWVKLARKMASEAKLGRIKSLTQDDIGFSWNAKIWRFEGQEELPVFDGSVRWNIWIKSEEGIEWRGKYADQ